jgi:hypothetical protein
MTHPLTEIAAAAVVLVAVGAGTMLVLPRPKPEPPAQTIVLDIETPDAVRAEPQYEKSDAERVDDLQRELTAIAAEQKKLIEELRAAAEAQAEEREGRAR